MRGASLSSRTNPSEDRRSVVSAGSSNASTLVADSLASTSSAANKLNDKSNLRKFTAGVGRPGLAREAREAARNVISTQNPTRKAPVAQPLDYERFLVEKSVNIDNDPQRELLVFPRDDIEETTINIDQPTAIPAVHPTDLRDANWLLTRDALLMYSNPQKSVVFNYSKFSGDYDVLHNSRSSADMDVALSSLVFESDMAEEEAKAAEEGFILSSDVIKEGFLQVVKNDPSLLDNLKSEKKRRWCILRRLEGGTIAFEVQKTPGNATGKPILRVNSAQLRATKKGRTVMEIEPCREDDEKAERDKEREKREEGKRLMVVPDSNDPRELSSWLQIINRALALANKSDRISISSGCTDGTTGNNSVFLNSTLDSVSGGDTDSIHSEESLGARDMTQWRGRNTAARALQPPIVDRRNIFSLYHRLAPVTDAKGEASSLLPCRSNVSTQSSPSTSPTPRRHKSTAGTLDKNAVVRFSVELSKLDLRLPVSPTEVRQIEPLFVRMFIFDSSTGRRLTEEFHVDVNDDDLQFMLISGRKPRRDENGEGLRRETIASTAAKKMVCTVAGGASSSIWLVIRVDRVLSSDLNGELYMKTTGDIKGTLKLQRNIQGACARLGAFRTRFAFAARRIFPELGTIVPGQINGSKGVVNGVDCLQLYRCDQNRLSDTDLHKYLSDFAKFEKASKFLIPGASASVIVNSSTRIFDFPLRISSSYLPLNPWRNDVHDPPVFDVQSFGDTVAEPHSSFVNLMYIYPLALKYDSQKVFSKARNISCTVRFIRGGEDVSKESFLDRLNPNGPFASSSSCAVQHHQHNPSFGDEMKLRLPLSLGQYDHLLFTFSHVSVMGQLNAKSPTDSVEGGIGYAWLPLVGKKERLLMESDEVDFSLCVAAELPKGYYRSKPLGIGKPEETSPDVKWVDTRPLFRVRLRLVSSVYTTQPKLQAYFQSCQRFEQKVLGGEAVDMLVKRSPSPEESTPRSCSPLAESPIQLDDDHPLVREVHQRTEGLCDVDIIHLIPFLPLVLNRLLSTLTLAATDSLALATLSTVISIVDRVSLSKRRRVLRHFVRSQLNQRDSISDEDSLHYAICKHLPTLLRSVQPSLDELASVYRQLSFLLDVTARSVAHTIVRKALYKSTRAERFSVELVETIGGLVDTLVPQMIAKHKEIPIETRTANTALAVFMRCCLSFMDRGAVFRWVHSIVSRLDQAESRGILREYKSDLLTVLIRHEHWLPLSLPLLFDSTDLIQRVQYESTLTETNTSSANSTGILARFFNQLFQSPSISEKTDTDRYNRCGEEWWLSEPYCRRHFPVGLLLQELTMCLREPREYRKRPISLVRNVLAKHGYDKRYADINYQRRIAILYTPLIRFALDNLNELESATPENGGSNYADSSLGVRTSNKWRSLEKGVIPPVSARFSNVFRPSPVPTPSSVNSTGSPSTVVPSPQVTPLAEKFDTEEVQDVLMSVVYILQRLPKKILGALWSEMEGEKAEDLLRLLEVIVDVFRYRGKSHAMAAFEQTNRMMQRASHVMNKPTTLSRMEEASDSFSFSSSSGGAPPFAVLQMLNLSQEIALIVLDVIQTFSQHLASSSCIGWSSSSILFSRLQNLHISLLSDDWPESVRLHTIAALALFVNMFRRRLLDSGPLDALSVLIERLLLLISSRLTSVQMAAAALLQIILRAGYENAATHLANEAMRAAVAPNSMQPKRLVSASERLGRPGAQTGVALARLLGSTPSLAATGRLEKGLTALDALVSVSDHRKQSPFDRAVLELNRQLRGVMTATGALNEAKNDPIRLADLHMQLADSYRGSAALRSTWLETLSSLHSSARYFSEAAVCMAHSVAVCARELNRKGELMSVDWSVLDWISRDIGVDEGVITEQRGENIQPAGFTIENLASKIEKTANLLTQSERYEAIGPLYRLIVPSLEKNANFNSLVSVYAELQQSYSRAVEVKTSGKRHLGAYFRVRFYGKNHFDADHDTEWVYREHGLTSLAEVSQRIGDYCRQVVGHDRVQVEPEKELDERSLDENIAYVQVTHVDPVVVDDQTILSYHTHTNLREFVYEKSITEGKRGEGEPAVTQTALCKTFLTVLGSFPSTRRRLRVTEKKRETYSPLEFACQKLRMKASQMKVLVDSSNRGTRPFDIKGLQLLLQGAVLPTVNAGPLVYAEAFTQTEQKKRYGEKGVSDLKGAFSELMSSCGAALKVNGSAIGPDQTTYHQVLMSSFEAMLERLESFFGCSFKEEEKEEKGWNGNEFPRSHIHILDSISGVDA
uniref:Uncharacterized protein n=1 Tax=Pristionchus pacificus TaxID=54126 RepID=A0A8R1YPV2_PRIPA